MLSIEAVDDRDGQPGRIVYGDDECPVRQGPVLWGGYQPPRHGIVEGQVWTLVDATLPLSIEAVDGRDGRPGRIAYGQGPVPWGGFQPARHGVVEGHPNTLWILVDNTLPLSIEAADERDGRPGIVVYGDDDYPVRQGLVPWGANQPARQGVVDGVGIQELLDQGVRPRPVGNHHQ